MATPVEAVRRQVNMQQVPTEHRAVLHALFWALVACALALALASQTAYAEESADGARDSIPRTLTLTSQADYTETSADGMWDYTVEAEKATITAYHKKGTIAQLDIPDKIDGYEVVAIGNSVFSGDTALTDVYLPPSITHLGGSAFAACTNLKTASLTAVEQLQVISDSCFDSCTSLTSIWIPGSVVAISGAAFKGCTSLAEVGFQNPSSLTYLAPALFKDCTALTSIELPVSVTTINSNAFEGCTALASVTFKGESVNRVDYRAFKDCTALTEIVFPDQLGYLEAEAFKGCTSLAFVAYGRGMPQSVGSDIYADCAALGMMFFPADASGNPPSASEMQRAGLKSGMAYLSGRYTAEDTVELTLINPTTAHPAITLPAAIGHCPIVGIRIGAARGNTALTQIVFPEDCQIAYISQQAFKGCTSLASIVIPASVQEIYEGAFEDCTALASVTYKTTSLEAIPKSCFAGCTGLAKAHIPEGVKTIGEKAFYNCTGVTSVDLDDTPSVYLPDTLESIGDKAFMSDTQSGARMNIATVRMPNSPNELGVPQDRNFFAGWNYDSVKFVVTYGSWSDAVWFEDHVSNHTLSEANRAYDPVDISDSSVVLDAAAGCSYNGAQHLPTVSASRWLRSPLVLDADFSVAPATGYDCTSVGQQQAVIAGLSPHFTGRLTSEYQIEPASVDNVTAPPFADKPWDDMAHEPVALFSIDFDGVAYTLQDGDYALSYANNRKAGRATITLTGQGNFQGTKDFHFNITKRPLTEADVSAIPDQRYTGGQITPKPESVLMRTRTGRWDLELIEDTDYTISYADNMEVGQATMTLAAIDDANVSYAKSVHFNIVTADLSDAAIGAVPDQVYTGSAIVPALDITLGAEGLVEGRDYSVTWTGNVNAGEATGTVTGIEPYCTGTRSVTFRIRPKSATVTADSAARAYTGGPLTAKGFTSEGLAEGDAVVFANVSGSQTDVGSSANVASEAKVENAAGEDVTADYDIGYEDGALVVRPADIGDADVAVPDQVYSGTALEPSPTVTWNEMLLVEGRDYEITAFEGNVHAGTAIVTVAGKGNFEGAADGAFEIAKRPASIAVRDQTYVFNGKQQGEGDAAYEDPAQIAEKVTVEGLQGSDALTSVILDGARVDVGVYEGEIKVTGFRIGEATDDYDVTLVPGTLTIRQKSCEVTFVNYDGAVLQSGQVDYGEMPEYAGKTPERAATEQYTYSFAGWTPEVAPVTGDATYKATYTETLNKYKVTFVDYDGTTVLKEAVEYGYGTLAADVERPDDPAREPDAQYTYTFSGWTPEVADVTAEAVYTAVYESGKRSYEVTWLQDDGTLIDKTAVEYGEKPVHADPSKAATAQYTYAFAGWTPEVAPVTGDATYKATYTETAKKGTLTFDCGGGTIDGKASLTIEADVGDVITIPKAPVRDGYTFKYWKGSEYHPGDKYTVEGDHTFTATWEKKPNNNGGNGGGGGAAKASSSPSTGDTIGAVAAALALAAACALFLALVALSRTRQIRQVNLSARQDKFDR